MQSAAEHVLAVLDRRHTPGRAVEAAHEARAAGFEHVNLDLIYGTPGETDADWAASLDAVLASPVDHVSAYALIVEEGTRLARRISRGELPMTDDDVLADRYVQADATLRKAGFDWYEVSNWATGDAARCRHNELYWANANWWGVGPGAHSHVGGVRWWNVKHPAAYADRLAAGLSPAQDAELLDDADRALETIMLGLRLRDGLPLDLLSATGRDRAAGARGATACWSRRPTPPVAPSSPTAGGCSPTPWSATSPTDSRATAAAAGRHDDGVTRPGGDLPAGGAWRARSRASTGCGTTSARGCVPTSSPGSPSPPTSSRR